MKRFLLLLALAAGINPASAQTRDWVTTWATALQIAEPHNRPPQPGLAGNSFRQIVQVSVGGTELRLHLSNLFNTDATEILGVEIAKAASMGATPDIDEDSSVGGVAVLLALMGVAGMLLLEMSYRRPELGIRQIFGSSTGQLLARANGKYALLCTVAFALSVPVSLLLIHQWLQMFVAHAPITVWLFLLAYLILLVLTALVVTVQTALSLRFEPVEVVRNS